MSREELLSIIENPMFMVTVSSCFLTLWIIQRVIRGLNVRRVRSNLSGHYVQNKGHTQGTLINETLFRSVYPEGVASLTPWIRGTDLDYQKLVTATSRYPECRIDRVDTSFIIKDAIKSLFPTQWVLNKNQEMRRRFDPLYDQEVTLEERYQDPLISGTPVTPRDFSNQLFTAKEMTRLNRKAVSFELDQNLLLDTKLIKVDLIRLLETTHSDTLLYEKITALHPGLREKWRDKSSMIKWMSEKLNI